MSTIDGPRSPGAVTVGCLGVANTAVCGVRDYAGVLERHLPSMGVHPVQRCWLELEGWSLDVRGFVHRYREWAASLQSLWEVPATDRPDCLLFHCSTPVLGARAVPVWAPLIIRAIRQTGIPLVTVLHEFSHPWRGDGVRGAVLASSYRGVILQLARCSSALIVTTEPRRDWLRSRRWLPRRPTAYVPVPPNIEPADHVPPVLPTGQRWRLGVLGYGWEGVMVTMVIAALGEILQSGDAELVLVGAPGPASAPGRHWIDVATRAGVGEHISFTGVLDPGEYSAALGSLDAVVVADRGGPSSRRGTLASALAHGRPIIASSGEEAWQLLGAEGAALMVAPEPSALAAGALDVLADHDLRRGLGAQARRFYSAYLTPGRVAREVAMVLEDVAHGQHRPTSARPRTAMLSSLLGSYMRPRSLR